MSNENWYPLHLAVGGFLYSPSNSHRVCMSAGVVPTARTLSRPGCGRLTRHAEPSNLFLIISFGGCSTEPSRCGRSGVDDGTRSRRMEVQGLHPRAPINQ